MTASRKLLSLLFLALLFLPALSPAASAQDLQTEIVYSTRADELAPLLSAMAGPDGSVAAYRDQLIIRATPDKLPLILDNLKKLDRPLKNLRVTVRRQATQNSSQRELGANGKVRIQNGDVSGRVDVRAQDQQRQSSGSNEYSVTATEGSSVLVNTGSDVPYLTVSASGNLGQQYVPVQSGMQVTPRLQPDGRVLLDVRFQQAELANRQGMVNREGTQTQIQSVLGQWTALSNIEQSVQVSGSGIASQYKQQSSSRIPLEIRVEEVP